jgi:hypothetical protein
MLGSKKARSGWLVLIALALLVAGTAVAQVISGSISGAVKDASGAYVSKATVTVKAAAIGVTRTTTTNADGMFVVPNLPPGNYTVSATAQGFKLLEKKDIHLSPGDRLSAGEFVLEVGASGTTVTVEADAGQVGVQSDSGERSGLITGNQLNNLAMNGRMLFDYIKVLPGVVSTFNGAESSKGGTGSIAINGTRPGSMQITLDGVTNVDNGCNCATQVTINPDAVSEVKVMTGNWQAEYGKAAGSQMAVTTKNGTNQFHGNGRWFHRDQGLNANNWFNDQQNAIDLQQGKAPSQPKQPYHYNYFGWQLGGPLLLPKTDFNKNRDKLYFFFSQEFYRQLLPGGYDKVYVPTLAEINGDFSQSVNGYGQPITIKDPTTGQPYPGNLIPGSQINPAIQQYLLKVLPRPNAVDNEDCSNQGSTLPNGYCDHYNFITSQTTTHPRREDIGRVDYQINQNNRLFFTVVNNAGTQFLPEGLSPQGISNFQIGPGMYLQEPGYNVSTHLTSNISNTLVNELTFGWTVNQQHIYSIDNYVDASNYNFGLPLVYPVTSGSPIPDMSFGGRNQTWSTWSYLGSLPWNNADTVINFTDNITKVLGKHTMKAGIFVERNRKDQSSWGNANGTFSFDSGDSNLPAGLNTGDPYANALLGDFTSFQQQPNRLRGLYRYTNLEFFVQDNFKVTHNLTLDYGMRFSWVQPQYDANNNVSYFDPKAYDPAQAPRLYYPYNADRSKGWDPVTGAQVPGALIGDIVPGTGNLNNGMVLAKNGGYAGGFKDRGVMPEPRFGFAWDIFGDSKTVLRGGAGMTHDRFQGNPIYNIVVGNPPNAYDPTFKYANVSDMATLQAAAGAPVAVYGFDQSGKVPTVYSYSFGLQRDLGFGTTLDVAYVGSQSRHLSQKYNLNAIPYGYLFTAAAQDPAKYNGNVQPETGWMGTSWVQAGYQYLGDNALPTNLVRPYLGYDNIEYWTWDGDANYNSLQISANKHFSKGLTFGVAYTWSKTMDTSNSDGAWTNIINAKKYNYQLASFDRPNVLALNWTYDLPKVSRFLGGSKILHAILDNYQWEGIGQFLDGGPGTIGINYSVPEWGGYGYGQMITGSYTEPAVAYVSGDPTAKTNDPYGHLNPAAFKAYPIGAPTFNWQKGYFRYGGTNNWDMSIFKNIPLGSNESRYLQLRVEAFNVFNHPQFWGINTDTGPVTVNGNDSPWDGSTGVFWNWTGVTTKDLQVVNNNNIRPAGKLGNMGQYFGEYNSGGNARIIQLGVKLYF